MQRSRNSYVQRNYARLFTWLAFAMYPVVGLAQFTYTYDHSIEVEDVTGIKLNHAWAGGLNAAQFNTIDLNADGKEDLVVFDRMGEKLFTFLNVDNTYVYAPEYETLFPGAVTRWLLLRDFNCDGRKDIFTGHEFGIQVLQNTSEPGQQVQWRQFYFYSGNSRNVPLLTKGFNTLVNLQLRYDDLPTIEDIDGDGDLDVMNVRFQGEGSVEYHKNFSMERFGICDSLTFERQTQQWGGFTQCICEDFVFNGDDCSTVGGRVKHGVGKALLAIDLNGDGEKDLLFSEAECDNIFSPQNKGTSDNPDVDEVQYFPATSPIDINAFPAAFYEDVDFDGTKDLISSQNIFQREVYQQDLKSSTWFYKNTGTNALPNFTLIKKALLQEEMIDVGDNSVPAFHDENGDGDLDLFISYNTDTENRGSIYFYENIGSPTQPRLKFVTDNFINFRSLELNNIKIQFADLNKDSKDDLIFIATDPSLNQSNAYYIINQNGFDVSEKELIPLALVSGENVHFTDISRDGLLDVLVGKANGSLQYLKNVGTSSSPQFELQDDAYQGLGSSTLRQYVATYTADLNSDSRLDLVYADQSGKITIVDNFLEVNDSEGSQHTDIIYNGLVDSFQQSSIGGRSWPTAANIMGTERPQIISGNILGGLKLLKNENRASDFDELVLSVYPNPVLKTETLLVDSNLGAELVIFSSVGKQVSSLLSISADSTNTFNVSQLAAGLYLLRFQFDDRYVIKRLVVR